jgi:hypothetical protein
LWGRSCRPPRPTAGEAVEVAGLVAIGTDISVVVIVFSILAVLPEVLRYCGTEVISYLLLPGRS